MKRLLIISVLTLLLPNVISARSFSAYDLRCEYMQNPLAVNTVFPKFSWKIASDQRGFIQAAYEITVGENAGDVREGKGNMWKTRRDISESLHVPYEGEMLLAGRTYYWSVRIMGSDGRFSPWSEPARFGIGLLDEKDWNGAEWIAMEIMPEHERMVPGVEYKRLEQVGDRNPGVNKLPQFRKELTVRKPVKKATAYVCGLGQFVFYLNGEKVGDHFLDPAWTDYDKLACYVPFDVTPMLSEGANALGVMLGNGFISVPQERYFKGFISYCYPKMILKLAVEYADGTGEVFVSDESWKTCESAVPYSSIFGGEDFDASREKKGWKLAGYDDSAWQDVLIAQQPARLIAQSAHPVRIMQEFPPVTVRQTRHGKWVYDLGQNFAGTVEITVSGRPGQSVVMNTSEHFDRDADSIKISGGYRGEYRLTYTLGSNGPETWHPRFTYFGQRYVLVSGAVPRGHDNPAGLPVIEELKGLHARNSTATAGTFHCSNELFNKTNKLIEWGIKGNMTSFMTDCPHREKLPWIEQLHLMFGSLQYNFDVYKLYEKMVDDMALAQWDNGLIPDITPMYFMFVDGFVDSPEWGSAFILAPWKIYEYYGDTSLIEKHYDRMVRYLIYLESMSTDHILSHGLGDWYDIGPKPPGVSQHTSLEATATPIFYMDAEVMRRAAELLGKKDDAARFARLAGSVKKSYNEKFFNAEAGYYDRNSQCANAIAYCAGLVEPQYEKAVLDNIVKDIRQRGNALSAGDVGYNYVLRALEANGSSDVIYDMNSRYDVFGYGYQLAQGMTALPETWDARVEKSLNHFMLGHLQEWFYTQIGGIQRGDNSLAYKTFTIKPVPLGDVTFARTTFASPYGEIATDWEIIPEGFRLHVSVPANTTATMWVPAGEWAKVTESGLDAGKAEGLQFIRSEGGYKIYSAGGGIYKFLVTE